MSFVSDKSEATIDDKTQGCCTVVIRTDRATGYGRACGGSGRQNCQAAIKAASDALDDIGGCVNY